MDEKSGKGVWESVVSAAKKMDAGIIAMASQTGPLASVLLGSTTGRSCVRALPHLGSSPASAKLKNAVKAEQSMEKRIADCDGNLQKNKSSKCSTPSRAFFAGVSMAPATPS